MSIRARGRRAGWTHSCDQANDLTDEELSTAIRASRTSTNWRNDSPPRLATMDLWIDRSKRPSMQAMTTGPSRTPYGGGVGGGVRGGPKNAQTRRSASSDLLAWVPRRPVRSATVAKRTGGGGRTDVV